MNVINADAMVTFLVDERDELQNKYNDMPLDTPEERRRASRVYGRLMGINATLAYVEENQVKL